MGSYVSVPAYTRSLPQRYRLIGQRCLSCGLASIYQTSGCNRCGPGAETEPIQLSHRGKIITYTIIEPGGAPSEFAEQVRLGGPYPVALIDLEGQARILAQITDARPEELKIGQPVVAVLRILYQQEGLIRYSFKFRPETI